MKTKINLLLTNLNEQLNFIDLEIDNQIKRCEKAIEISITTKEKLRTTQHYAKVLDRKVSDDMMLLRNKFTINQNYRPIAK